MEKQGNWIKKHPVWTGVIGIFGLVMLVMIVTPNTNDCPKCNCPVCKCQECNCPSTEVLENKFIVMCVMYNAEVELINELMDWVDNYANPTGIVLTRQIKVNCYELLEK